MADLPQPIGIPDRSFPESLTSTRDGTLYVCSNDMTGIGFPGPSDIKGDVSLPGQSRSSERHVQVWLKGRQPPSARR